MIRGEEEVNLYLHSVINETDFPILIPERGVVKVQRKVPPMTDAELDIFIGGHDFEITDSIPSTHEFYFIIASNVLNFATTITKGTIFVSVSNGSGGPDLRESFSFDLEPFTDLFLEVFMYESGDIEFDLFGISGVVE
jgi:hypothetical protein